MKRETKKIHSLPDNSFRYVFLEQSEISHFPFLIINATAVSFLIYEIYICPLQGENDLKFIRGQVVKTLKGSKFIEGETTVTADGLKFVAG